MLFTDSTSYLDGQGGDDGLGVDQAGVTKVVQACTATHTSSATWCITNEQRLRELCISVACSHTAAGT